MFERDEVEYLDFALEENAERVHEQKETEIKIIIGNPPYSVGQKSANDNAQNNFYPKLEQRISDTYAAGTNATNKNSLYDSYIKAFRWASDRIKDSGVIGFVTNAGWIDGAAMDGMRNCFVNEFSEVYVFNLRGNARTQGELRRREKDNVFGQGSRAPIAITILVKNPQHNGDAQIHYLDIGDYLSRDEKLARIKNLRTVLSDEFETYLPLAPDKKFNAAAQSFFVVNSRGLATARDTWAYNFSRNELAKNIQLTIDTYNVNREKYFSYNQKYVFDFDSKKISWSGTLIDKAESNFIMTFDDSKIFLSMYRPFSKSNLYFDDSLN